MSYVAEPYAQFVDDILTALTGGEIRERFVFLPENEPYDLSPPGPVRVPTVRIHGQAGQRYQRFAPNRDYEVVDGKRIVWRARDDGTPAADAIWPDEGTPFFIAYDHAGPSGAAPILSDRNPGSVTRLLSESFGREYAVLSRQLEAVYSGAYLETATGRDLDALVALVGLERRRASFATGTVVFSRPTPAPADINIPAGTRLSTAEPPPVVFETTEARTLRRGALSVETPIQAMTGGADAIVPINVVRVIHQPILGVSSVGNPQATAFGGADETDEALRSRARRALEGAGRSTVGALISALTTLPGVRDKDIRVSEDHLEHPGVVRLDVVADLDESQRAQAARLIEETRPAGIRVIHNLGASRPLDGETVPPAVADADPAVESPPVGLAPGAEGRFPVGISVVATPAAADLGSAERNALAETVRQAVRSFVDEAGVGETLVYNRLVANLMALDGVLDVDLELYAPGVATSTRRRNLMPAEPAQRPSLDDAVDLRVEIGGAPVAIDLSVRVQLQGAGLVGDTQTNLDAARIEIDNQLAGVLPVWPIDRAISVPALDEALQDTDSYKVAVDHYKVDYVEAGVRILKKNPTIDLTGLERLWLRTLEVIDGGEAT